jgi:hypothetical protein
VKKRTVRSVVLVIAVGLTGLTARPALAQVPEPPMGFADLPWGTPSSGVVEKIY